MTTIDVHAHVATPQADRELSDQPGYHAQLAEEGRTLGEATLAYNRAHMPAMGPKLMDVALRLEAMDAAGIGVQTVSATTMSRHWMEPELARRHFTQINAAVADHCAAAPTRLAPVAAVPLHLPGLAVDVLRSAVNELGMVGVQISTTAGYGVELDHASLAPFWEEAVALDIPVLIHPWGCTLGERLDVGYMFNHVGNPTETSVALSRLIFGGVLDRFPDLRVWAAHAGGWLPSYSGRADHAWHAREDARTSAQPPSTYLRRMWFDALVYTAPALRFLVQSVGVERVTLGTDYPFDMGVDDPIERVEAAFSDAKTREAICASNAHALFGPRLAARIAGNRYENPYV